MKLYDMHCHIDLMPSMVDFALKTKEAGIGIIAVTTTPKAYEKEVDVFRNYPNVSVALGLHPQLIAERYNEVYLIDKYIKDAPFIGEVGLDFNKGHYHSKEQQLDAFEHIIRSCRLYGNKLISVHSVHADKQVLDILEHHSCLSNNNVILHWFSGSARQLHRAVELGCYFSINFAMVKSPNGQNIIKSIPQERLMLETDAPFIEQIRTVQQLTDSLQSTLDWLIDFFGTSVEESITRNSGKFMEK